MANVFDDPTLGELKAALFVCVFAQCRCSHIAYLDIDMLIARAGPDTPWSTISRRLVCSLCLTKRIKAVPLHLSKLPRRARMHRRWDKEADERHKRRD